MPTSPTIDNTIHFHIYNATTRYTREHGADANRMASEKRRNIARRTLQAVILQILISAERRPVHIGAIAEHIFYSLERTRDFLVRHHDDLWTPYNGDMTRWISSLRDLPDRLFY